MSKFKISDYVCWRPEDIFVTEFTILSYADYRYLHHYKLPPVPNWNGFWEYFFWAKAHGFTPYGGEAKLDEQTIFELNVQQIRNEWKAQQREWRMWLDIGVET